MHDIMDQTPGEVFLTAFHRKSVALEMAKRTAYFTAALGGYRDVKAYDQHFPPEKPQKRIGSTGQSLKNFFERKRQQRQRRGKE